MNDEFKKKEYLGHSIIVFSNYIIVFPTIVLSNNGHDPTIRYFAIN